MFDLIPFDITREIMEKSVQAQPLCEEEPFLSGDEAAVTGFYECMFAALRRDGVDVLIEDDHHGSGYASYISAFLSRRGGVDEIDHPAHVETVGLLLYVSRLAPIAVFGASSRTRNKRDSGTSSGFITTDNLDRLPPGDWSGLLRTLRIVLEAHGVELLPTAPLLAPAPDGIRIPTAFDGPYAVFDTLFYWED
ncbi:hypothetical protein [Lysobacter hankyongensis]|uniref:DUF1320 domain-containing protein n=1 Tax=Lysobacter hankyongensis TaxID=1176535 RepID=A0ABP9B179_9GAMM